MRCKAARVMVGWMNSRTTAKRSSSERPRLLRKTSTTASWAGVSVVCRRWGVCEASSTEARFFQRAMVETLTPKRCARTVIGSLLAWISARIRGVVVAFLCSLRCIASAPAKPLGPRVNHDVNQLTNHPGHDSYLDDRHDIPARWRFLIHLLAAVLGLWWIGGFPALSLFGLQLQMGLLGIPIGVLFVVWLLNLYNFMDGIDGIAGTEAVTVAVSGALLHWMHGEPEVAMLLLSLAAASMGFLLWNWPPAKIFMVDVGSGFLGFVFAVLALGLSSGALNLWVWLILLGVFVVDATYTLLRRLVRGERVYQAHRSHAYQRGARRWGSHKNVTLAVGAINVFWLLPLAWVAAVYPDWGVVALAVAWLPLLGVAVALGAGTSND